MVRLTKLTIACVAVILSIPGATFGSIIEVGDLNIIDQAGNASDGLRFLDMTFSDGKNKADALANAQATYSNARLATQYEWDDLFEAAGITYNGAKKASDAFTVGTTKTISSEDNYDNGILMNQLGKTHGTKLFIWSDPDGSSSATGTRDRIRLVSDSAKIQQNANKPALGSTGWLIVSAQMAPIPEPSSIAMWSAMGIIGLVVARRKRKLTRAA